MPDNPIFDTNDAQKDILKKYLQKLQNPEQLRAKLAQDSYLNDSGAGGSVMDSSSDRGVYKAFHDPNMTPEAMTMGMGMPAMGMIKRGNVIFANEGLGEAASAMKSQGYGRDIWKQIRGEISQPGEAVSAHDINRYLDRSSILTDSEAENVANKFAQQKNLEKIQQGQNIDPRLLNMSKQGGMRNITPEAALQGLSQRNRGIRDIKNQISDLQSLGQEISNLGPETTQAHMDFYNAQKDRLKQSMQNLNYKPNKIGGERYRGMPDPEFLKGGDVITNAKDLFAFTPPKFPGEGRTQVIPVQRPSYGKGLERIEKPPTSSAADAFENKHVDPETGLDLHGPDAPKPEAQIINAQNKFPGAPPQTLGVDGRITQLQAMLLNGEFKSATQRADLINELAQLKNAKRMGHLDIIENK